MKKYFFILLLLISASGYSQAPNIIYGKDVIIQTRDTSSAELTIKNSTRNVLGYFKNIGGGKGQYTVIPQVDITGLPDSLLSRYTKSQSDARYKPISYVPDWLELTGVPSNFSTTYALSNDIQDSLLNKVSRSGTYTDPSFISSLSWSKLTGVPALVTLADSTTILAGRWLPNRSADTAAALQARIQTKTPLEGSASIITVGTIGTGTWQASPIADAYISSAATWNAKQNALGFTPENLANKGVANGYADLDALGKIPASRIDFTQTGQTFVVASQAAMLAISGANVGAIAIRTDENKNYRLIGLPASTLSNWLALLTPDAPVQSVNGFTGNVNLLTTHITEGSNYYWTAARSRAAQSLTTSGSSGAASYDNTTGVLNIPTYTLAGLGGQPALSGTGFVKISGTTISYDNSTYLTSYTETDPTIYSWAKAASKPSYSWGEITGTVPTWNQNTTGNAATATTATNWSGSSALGSYAYRSSGLAELSGASFSGAISFSGTSTSNGRLNIYGPGTTSATYGLVVDPSGGGVDNFTVRDDGQIYMRGNVGIGTTSPGYKLDVNGTLGVAGAATFSGSLSGTTASFSGTGTFNSTGGGIAMYLVGRNNGGLDESGIVFLKNDASTRNALLEGNNGGLRFYTGTSTILALTLASTGAATFSSSVTANSFSVSNGSISNSGFWGTLITAGAGSFADFGIVNSGSNRVMHIPTGTRNVVFADGVTVDGSLGVGGVISAGSTITTSSYMVGAVGFYTSITSTSVGFNDQGSGVLAFRAGNVDGRATLNSSGTLSVVGDVIAYSTSDRRLKDNIRPIENALYKLGQLSGNEFDWNSKQETYQGHDYGVIAQEVAKVLPYAVTIRETGFYGVKYERIIPLLIESIKELKKEVDLLKSK